MPSRPAPPHFAISERPAHTPSLTPALRTLRQVAGRLQATSRQRTRTTNQFHQLLALAFPELALLVKDISLGWILELVQRYPIAQLLAGAMAADLAAIPYLTDPQIQPLLEHARASVASLQDAATAEFIRDQVRQLRDVHARQKRREKTLVQAYHALPTANLIDSIPSIGDVTAAVLTAIILDIDRFATPNKLVAFFGVMPIEMSSGVERDGQPRGPRRYVMSRRGNDLVRRYLWMAALSAVRFNPAARALFRRVVANIPSRRPSPSATSCASCSTLSSPSGKAASRSTRNTTPGSRRTTWPTPPVTIHCHSNGTARRPVTTPCHSTNRLRATSRHLIRRSKWSPQPVLSLYHPTTRSATTAPSTSRI
jgi:hypothetical protein